MRALVTGGNGFIGSFLIEKLIKQGCEVRCLIRKTSNLQWIKNFPVEFVYGDILQIQTLTKLVKNIDFVFHLGGLTKAKNEVEYFCVNVQGTENLLQAILNSGSEIKKFILASSLAAAGPGEVGCPIIENRPLQPISPYGKSKAEAEKIALKFAERIPVTILRPPPVYGPRDTDVFEVFKFVKLGIKPRISGPARRTSMIYIDDLVQGLLLAAEKDVAKGKIYFLSDGHEYTWEEISEAIQKALNKYALGVTIPAIVMEGVARLAELAARISHKAALLNRYKVLEMKQLSWVCDTSKAKIELGFQPQFTLEEGVKRTTEWYLREKWL